MKIRKNHLIALTIFFLFVGLTLNLLDQVKFILFSNILSFISGVIALLIPNKEISIIHYNEDDWKTLDDRTVLIIPYKNALKINNAIMYSSFDKQPVLTTYETQSNIIIFRAAKSLIKYSGYVKIID